LGVKQGKIQKLYQVTINNQQGTGEQEEQRWMPDWFGVVKGYFDWLVQ
jgi:hypothetical protein